MAYPESGGCLEKNKLSNKHFMYKTNQISEGLDGYTIYLYPYTPLNTSLHAIYPVHGTPSVSNLRSKTVNRNYLIRFRCLIISAETARNIL